MIGDIVKAQIIINKALEVKAQYDKLAKDKEGAVVLEAQQPASGASGRNAGHVEPFLGSLAPLEKWPDRGRALIDHVLALLPFEPPYMTAAGMTCDFVGHPVVTEALATPAVTPRATRDAAPTWPWP